MNTLTDFIIENGVLKGYAGEPVDVIIPQGVTSIADVAFNDCCSITSVTIPGSVERIGSHSFSDCKGLEKVVIHQGVKSIGDRAFKHCNNLKSIDIPDSVTEIGDWSFHLCDDLACVVIPGGVERIGDHAFDSCRGLEWLVIKNGVKCIGSEAFAGALCLTSIIIPDSVTSIEEQAFYYSESLIDAYIPEGVTSIEKDAFAGCKLLTIHTPQGSYAEKYAKENNIRVKHLKELPKIPEEIKRPIIKSPIKLTKELLNEDLFDDVVFVMMTSPKTMRDFGCVSIIKRDDTEYCFNYLKDDIKCADVEEFFPLLKQLERNGKEPEGWHIVDVGLEKFLAVKDDIFDKFKFYARPFPIEGFNLYDRWRIAIRLALRGTLYEKIS